MKLDFRQLYKQEVVPMMSYLFGYGRVEEVPKLVKVSLNRGIDPSKSGTSDMKSSEKELSMVSGQKPHLRKARKSVSGFKIREGMSVGLSLNMRGSRMYAFVAKLVHVVLPRVRDFRGLGWEGFDRSGNYNFGIDDQLVFPELSYDDVKKTRGVGLSLITSSITDVEADHLLTAFGFLFTSHPFLEPRPGWSNEGQLKRLARAPGPMVASSPLTLSWVKVPLYDPRKAPPPVSEGGSFVDPGSEIPISRPKASSRVDEMWAGTLA